jgi:hypothetical protein
VLSLALGNVSMAAAAIAIGADRSADQQDLVGHSVAVDGDGHLVAVMERIHLRIDAALQRRDDGWRRDRDCAGRMMTARQARQRP